MFSQWGRWGKTSVQTFSNHFLKVLAGGAVTTAAVSLLQYFTTPTENAVKKVVFNLVSINVRL